MNKKPLIFIARRKIFDFSGVPAKTLFLLSIFLLLMTSFAAAEVFNITETRPRIFLDVNFDKMVWSGVDDLYLIKGGSFTFYRTENNFTNFPIVIGGAGGFEDFFALVYNNTPLIRAGGSVTGPSTIVAVSGGAPTSISMTEFNIFGVGSNSVNSLNLNPVTPLAYNFVGIDGLSFDQNNNFLYVLHNTTKDVNVYDLYKNSAIYSVDYVRTFTLNESCGYTHPKRIDFEIFGDKLYLLCGNANQAIDRTIYSYNLAGDFQNQYNLNAPDNQYISVTVSPSTNELIVYDDTTKEFAFFNFTGSGAQPGGEIVLVGGDLYNTSALCIDNNRLNSNATVSVSPFGQIIIDGALEDNTWCSAGCFNIEDGNGIIQGVCQQNACTSECQNPNFQTCETPNTYSLCVNPETDGCLDLNTGLFCGANLICEDLVTQELGAQCIDAGLTQVGDLYTQPFISVNIEVNHTNVYEVLETELEVGFTLSTIPNFLPISIVDAYFLKSLLPSITQEVKISGTSELLPTAYHGLSCDFTENYLIQDYLETNTNLASNNTIINGLGVDYIDINTTTTYNLQPSTLSQEIELMIKTLGSGSTTIRYLDVNKEVLSLNISYDSASRNLLVRDNFFDKLLVNETSPTINDSLSRIVIVTTHIKEADTNNVKIIVIRETNGIETQQQYFSLPIGYSTLSANKPDRIIIDTIDTTTRLFQVIQKEQAGYPIYTTNPIGTCVYTSLTCKNQRAFTNTNQVASYYFYEDLKTCVSQLNGVNNADPESQPTGETGTSSLEEFLGVDLSSELKTLLSVIIIALSLGAAGFLYSESREKSVLVGGVIVSGLWLFYFTLIGFLPVWIVVTLGVVAVGFVVRLGVNTFAN